jgi:ankyrin repeat protein
MKMYCFFALVLICFAFSAGISADSSKSREFLDAVDTGDLETVRELLADAPALISIQDNRTKGSFGPPLRLAIRRGHADIVEFLLSRDANPNQRYADGMGPLHEAAEKGDADLVEALAQYGADLNSRNGGFIHPPLCLATSREVTEALIARGADVSLRDGSPSRGTPLHTIAGYGQTAAAEVLLAHGADIEAKGAFGRTPLHRATNSGRGKMIELLIAKGANINAKDGKGLTALNLAVDSDWGIKADRKNAAEVLISHGAEYTIRDVAWLGDVSRVDALLRDNPALAGDTGGAHKEAVLFAAVREGHSEVVKLLLGRGAKLDIGDRYGYPPLHIAAHAGHKAVARALLEAGSDVNEKGPQGELAIHWAAAKGRLQVADLLVGRDLQINTKTQMQRVDMDATMQQGADAVKHQLKLLELLEKGRQATLRGSSLQIAPPPRLAFAAGDTPLHSAAQWGREEIVKILLSNEADVDPKNDWGQAPLHYACVFRHTDIVKMLLDAGAAPDAEDNDGHTPLGLASSPKGDPARDIVQVLRTKGATD